MPPLDTDPDTEPTYIEPVIPPGVSEDTAFSIRAQARQHFERMGESRATRKALGIRLERIEADLAAKPGKTEVRLLMTFAMLIFTVMLMAFLTGHGINTAQAVTDATHLVTPLSTPETP